MPQLPLKPLTICKYKLITDIPAGCFWMDETMGCQESLRSVKAAIKRLSVTHGSLFGLSSNSPLLAVRDEFEFGRIQLHRRVSRVDVIPFSLSHDLEALDRLQGEFIERNWGSYFYQNLLNTLPG
jgi:hypothetical protein